MAHGQKCTKVQEQYRRALFYCELWKTELSGIIMQACSVLQYILITAWLTIIKLIIVLMEQFIWT